MKEAGHPKLVLLYNPEGWGGEGGVWGDTCTPWLIHVDAWQNPPQYCKVVSLQFK